MTTVAIVLSEAGYYWEEAAAAYQEWEAARWKVVFYTPTGAVPTADPTSLRHTPLPLRSVGYGTSRKDGSNQVGVASCWPRSSLPAPWGLRSRLHRRDLRGRGHGCLQDINRNEELHRIIEALYLNGCVLSSVCHATSTFAFAKRPDGRSIVRGKRLTGCPNLADDLMIRFGMVHMEVGLSGCGALASPRARGHERRRATPCVGTGWRLALTAETNPPHRSPRPTRSPLRSNHPPRRRAASTPLVAGARHSTTELGRRASSARPRRRCLPIAPWSEPGELSLLAARGRREHPAEAPRAKRSKNSSTGSAPDSHPLTRRTTPARKRLLRPPLVDATRASEMHGNRKRGRRTRHARYRRNQQPRRARRRRGRPAGCALEGARSRLAVLSGR